MVTTKIKPSTHIYSGIKRCLATKMEVYYHLENVACEVPKGHTSYVQDFISLACTFTAL